MEYFKDCKNPQEVKAEYKRLAKIHHPDLGGDVKIMQIINEQYKTATIYSSLSDGEELEPTGNSRTARRNPYDGDYEDVVIKQRRHTDRYYQYVKEMQEEQEKREKDLKEAVDRLVESIRQRIEDEQKEGWLKSFRSFLKKYQEE